MDRQNWAGNIQFTSDNVETPGSIDELRSVVRRNNRVKVQGTRHSFNTIADGDGVLVSLGPLDRIDTPAGGQVRVGGGVDYGALAVHLQSHGLALHNMASLPHISVAGAVATATHGSGVDNGNLSTAVEAIQFVDGLGELRSLSRKGDPDTFPGAIVALGALGIVVETTLRVEASYQVAQMVYLDLPLEELKAHFDEVKSCGYSVSLFTNWSKRSVNQVWVKRRIDQEAKPKETLFGAHASMKDLHPLEGLDPANCTQQVGVPGAWLDRLPHFRRDMTPSAGDELQSEYFVSAEHGLAAYLAVASIGSEVSPLLHVSEIRFVAADDLWMSPAYKRDVVGIHFTWRNNWERVRRLLPLVEQALAPFSPVPHWGKLSTIPKEVLVSRYPRLRDFHQLVTCYDPERKFTNDYLRGIAY